MTSEKIVPISPGEALELKINSIPDEVIQSFNELIVANLTQSGESYFTQNDLVKKVLEKMNKKAIPNRWLDVSELFKEYGWCVVYNRPCYDEDFEPSYTFKKL